MAQIIVMADGPEGTDVTEVTEVHRERIVADDVATEAASSLLIERIGWALSDATEIEDRTAGEERRPAASAMF